MKKNFLLAFLLLGFLFQINAQPFPIGGTIIGTHFLQGNTGVSQTFRTMGNGGFPANTNDVGFVISNANYSIVMPNNWASMIVSSTIFHGQ